MPFDSWHELYQHDAQALYAPLVAPVVFLLYRAAAGARRGGVVPAAAGFVDGYAILFAIETILDPIATVALGRWLGISDGGAATAVLLLFVLLGDFRVFLLLFALAAVAAGRSWRGAIGRAAAWTLIVPIGAYSIYKALGTLFPGLPSEAVWLVYELGFLAMALYLRALWVPRHVIHRGLAAYLRAVLAYAALYYALWASADVLVQVGGVDAGWALRILPNQLYYALWIPFVYALFFAPWYQSTSVSTQAER